MAVYTAVSTADLTDFLADYDLGGLESFEGIRQGVENTNYHLYTTRGHFILTLFEKRVSEADLPFFFAFTAHLGAHGISCPQAMLARNGQVIHNLCGRPAVIVSFLAGANLAGDAITPAHCRAVGALAARMHKAAEGFALDRPNDLGPQGWKELLTATLARGDDAIPGIMKKIGDEIAYLEEYWPDMIPHGVVHADLFPDNVLFDDAGRPGVIDFYFACTDFYAYDLAIIINAWCFDAAQSFRGDCYDALLAGYQSERPLHDFEKLSLPVLLRGAALRFLLTRLYDWVNHDDTAHVTPKDPRAYLRILEYHQDDRQNRQRG